MEDGSILRSEGEFDGWGEWRISRLRANREITLLEMPEFGRPISLDYQLAQFLGTETLFVRSEIVDDPDSTPSRHEPCASQDEFSHFDYMSGRLPCISYSHSEHHRYHSVDRLENGKISYRQRGKRSWFEIPEGKTRPRPPKSLKRDVLFEYVARFTGCSVSLTDPDAFVDTVLFGHEDQGEDIADRLSELALYRAFEAGGDQPSAHHVWQVVGKS